MQMTELFRTSPILIHLLCSIVHDHPWLEAGGDAERFSRSPLHRIEIFTKCLLVIVGGKGHKEAVTQLPREPRTTQCPYRLARVGRQKHLPTLTQFCSRTCAAIFTGFIGSSSFIFPSHTARRTYPFPVSQGSAADSFLHRRSLSPIPICQRFCGILFLHQQLASRVVFFKILRFHRILATLSSLVGSLTLSLLLFKKTVKRRQHIRHLVLQRSSTAALLINDFLEHDGVVDKLWTQVVGHSQCLTRCQLLGQLKVVVKKSKYDITLPRCRSWSCTFPEAY